MVQFKKYASIGTDNGFVPNKWQAIMSWTNDDLD